jgi:hypothetical protein
MGTTAIILHDQRTNYVPATRHELAEQIVQLVRGWSATKRELADAQQQLGRMNRLCTQPVAQELERNATHIRRLTLELAQTQDALRRSRSHLNALAPNREHAA